MEKKSSNVLYARDKSGLAWELGVVYEYDLSSKGDCLAKPASCHFSCSPSAKLHLSGAKCLECSVG